MSDEPIVLPTLSVDYDPYRDVLKVEGISYAGGMFRGMALLPLGARVEIVGRSDCTVTLRQLPPEHVHAPGEVPHVVAVVCPTCMQDLPEDHPLRQP